MAIPPDLFSITVEITAVAGVPLLTPIPVIVDLVLPAENGIVTVNVLGVEVQVPAPSVDFTTNINVAGLGLLTITIQATPV